MIRIKWAFLGREAVINGVPLGSILGYQLFVIHISHPDGKTKCNILQFADDSKEVAVWIVRRMQTSFKEM